MNFPFPARRSIEQIPQLATDQVTPREPSQKAIDFMDHHHGLEKKVHDQSIQLGHAAVETATQRCRIEYLEAELAKSRVECKMYMRGYFALHEKIGAFATLGADAMRGLASAAIKMLEHANEEMRAAGIVPPEPDQPSKGDDGAAAIGATFGANARQEEADA